MSPHDGAVDHRVLEVSILGEMRKDALPDAGFGPAAEASRHVLPLAQALRQVTPGKASAITVKHGLNEPTIVRSGHANGPRPARQMVLDPLPLVVAQSISGRGSAFAKADL